jgi:hypothetical protein
VASPAGGWPADKRHDFVTVEFWCLLRFHVP